MKADYIVTGAVYTAQGSIEEAMAVKDGIIVYVGNRTNVREYCGAGTKVIDAGFGMVIPGITEGHAHVTSTYEILNYAPLYQGNSIEEYQKILRKFINEHPHESVLMGRGYKNGVFPKPGPRAEMLDEVCRDLPMIMIGEDAHSVWMNTKALELAGITCETEEIVHGEIVRYPDGTPTGWLKEAADRLALPVLAPLKKEKVKEAILHYQRIAMENGITHVFEPMLNSQRDYVTCMEAYEELAREGRLKLRFQVGYMLYPGEDVKEGIATAEAYRRRAEDIGSDRYCLDTIKLFVDGVLEGRTAYLLEEYQDEKGGCGEPLWAQEQLDSAVQQAAGAGFQVHIHTIGDGALDMAIHAFSQAEKKGLKPDKPHAVTHVQIVSEHQFDQLAELGIAVVVNPYWHTKDALYFEKIEKPYLGKERAEQEYPVKSFLKAGCLVSQASDFPVTIPADVFTGLHILVNRGEHRFGSFEPLNPKEALTVEEALQVLTLNGAKQGGIQEHTGSLSVGKDADFAILDKNLLTELLSELYTAKVKALYIKGICVYEKEEAE